MTGSSYRGGCIRVWPSRTWLDLIYAASGPNTYTKSYLVVQNNASISLLAWSIARRVLGWARVLFYVVKHTPRIFNNQHHEGGYAASSAITVAKNELIPLNQSAGSLLPRKSAKKLQKRYPHPDLHRDPWLTPILL